MGLKKKITNLHIMKPIVWCHRLSKYYRNENNDFTELRFFVNYFRKVRVINNHNNKVNQICKLINTVNVCPSKINTFFYSIDVFKTIDLKYQQLDNYSIDYDWVVNSSLKEILNGDGSSDSSHNDFKNIELALLRYVNKLKKHKLVNDSSIKEISSLFERPAEHFHEAIQRILFINQWLWQSGHKHNGFGHLDWILYDLYKKDINERYITQQNAREYLIDFFKILHENCWFKSTMLLGDTGQIVVLGGLRENGTYYCNELTYLFIDVSKELKLPDPKVLLRVSKIIPDDLLTLAIECISTGIGAPFISNDDVVIPSLIQFGYDIDDAYNYCTSACWEPLTIGKSCDQNNIRTVNFCAPFISFLDSEEFEKCNDIQEVKDGYYNYLNEYLDDFLSKNLDNKVFEEDPLLTLFNPEILRTGKDVVRGGAKYANLGLTSVGMSTVVNSLLNLESLVFENKHFSLQNLNAMRKMNFKGKEDVIKLLDESSKNYGNDSDSVISLTNEIMGRISITIGKHKTKLGGDYKYGLSSPNYIVDSQNIGATFDGRRAGQPFGVHISGKNGLSPTELISFASKLDYKGNRINGNVVDFIMSPGFIKQNTEKAVKLIKGGIIQGFYQLQINVIDSNTLIEAQKNPNKYPDLIVRVWGFSAYFRDLPREYQNNLIKRTIDAEKAA